MSEGQKGTWQQRQESIRAIEGLEEILAAREDLNAYYEELRSSFRDVGGLGVREMPQYDFDAAYRKYSRAEAYLRSEEYSKKHNMELSIIGDKALEEVIWGDYRKAMRDMEEDLAGFTRKHIWD